MSVRGRLRVAALVTLLAAGLGVTAVPASAAKVGTIMPVFECSTHDDTSGMYTAWYGYDNTGDTAGYEKADTGMNRVLGSSAQPQPETFEPGSHANVFSVVTTGPYSGWTLDGTTVYADYTSAGACAEAALPAGGGMGLPLLIVGFGLLLPLAVVGLSRQRRHQYASLPARATEE